MTYARTELTADSFVKRIDLADDGFAFRVELEKARRMGEIFSARPEFSTPALLDADPSTGELVFERMPEVRPFLATESQVWFERAGRALALTHTRLALPEALDRVRREDEGQSGTVVLHGDYMPNNMALAEDRLIVFDWGLRPWNAERYTRGTPAIDLAGFFGPWMLPRWWDLGFPQAKLEVMLDVYLNEVGADSDVAQLLRRTLLAEVEAQVCHRGDLIADRAAFKRSLARLKLERNHQRIAESIRSRFAFT